MQIKILFDKNALDKALYPTLTGKRKVYTGWGVSFLVDDRILFDTGEKGQWLLENMKTLGVNVAGIEAVVISHDHWDHVGGLRAILKCNPKVKVYACPNFSKRFKNKVKSYESRLIEVDKFTRIQDSIYSTGEIPGRYAFRYMPEQGLVLRTRKGLTILTGCAHPGIIKMIENVKQNISGKIYLVMGGFHLMGKHKKTIKPIVKEFKDLGAERIAPTHCTGENAVKLFKEAYQKNFIEIKVGQILEI
ncbi:MAG: MBL fold metallo-hydrolase [Patescibacteria group bacterium]|nr:MBL fold metallo-hydrolase [Patescibacteria group bacterium]